MGWLSSNSDADTAYHNASQALGDYDSNAGSPGHSTQESARILEVEIHAIIKVDLTQWALIDPADVDNDHDPQMAEADEIAHYVRGLWPIEDTLPRWARGAVTVVEER